MNQYRLGDDNGEYCLKVCMNLILLPKLQMLLLLHWFWLKHAMPPAAVNNNDVSWFNDSIHECLFHVVISMREPTIRMLRLMIQLRAHFMTWFLFQSMRILSDTICDCREMCCWSFCTVILRTPPFWFYFCMICAMQVWFLKCWNFLALTLVLLWTSRTHTPIAEQQFRFDDQQWMQHQQCSMLVLMILHRVKVDDAICVNHHENDRSHWMSFLMRWFAATLKKVWCLDILLSIIFNSASKRVFFVLRDWQCIKLSWWSHNNALGWYS